jgi:beta-lactamase regulating signal transducer with metallopeptidase domain
MDNLLCIGLGNAVMATLLALVAASVSLVCRRPALVHGLWLLVLLKLLTPPLLPVTLPWPLVDVPARSEATLEHPGHDGAVPTPAADVADEAPRPAEVVESQETTPRKPLRVLDRSSPQPAGEPAQRVARAWALSWQGVVSALWLTGSLTWLTLAVLRIGRFRRVLRHAHRASADLQEQTRRLAQSLGLAHGPEVWCVSAPVSPLLWALAGKPRILLPTALWERLTARQRDALLVHELAHVRRGDHWIRRLEFLALALYWWHPVAWWARRELQEAEEQCCDAWVVEALPGEAPAYAEALVQTAAFLSRPRPALPLGTSGIGHVHCLKRRLTMILSGTKPRALSRAGCLALLGLGLAALPWLPTAAQQPAQEPSVVQRGEDVVPPATGRPELPRSPSGQATPGSLRERPDQARPDQPSQLKAPELPKAPQSRTPPAAQGAERSEEIQRVRDEIELLEVQLTIKKAQILAVEQRLELARTQLARFEQLAANGAISQELVEEARKKLIDGQSQVRIQQAEAREPEVRLKQAQRRLASLEQPKRAPSAEEPRLDDRTKLQELEKKIDALQKALESLRRDLRPPVPTRPEKPGNVSILGTRDVTIPIKVDRSRGKLFLTLWISTDQGARWSKAQTVASDQDHFSFKAPADGEYWFTVTVVDPAESKPDPEPIVRGQDMVKVRIDTTPRRKS